MAPYMWGAINEELYVIANSKMFQINANIIS